MAVYFLAKSATYNSKTEPAVYRRREVVCEHLKKNYKARRNADEVIYQEIVRELAAEGIDISRSAYQSDKAVMRAAYQWLLAGTDDKRREVYEKVSASIRSGIACLSKDGIKNWADLKLDTTPTDEGTGAAPPQPAENPKLADSPAGQQVARLMEQLMKAFQAMIADNAELAEAASQSDEYIAFVEAENAILEERLRQRDEIINSVHASTLKEIAEQHPEFSQLLTIAEQMKLSAGRRQLQMQELRKRLPSTFAWASETGKMDYKPAFLQALADLKAEEQTQVISQLKNLGTHGFKHGSLNTNKALVQLPCSPRNCFISRGADDLRFTWTKARKGSITIHWLYRKGDSRVRQSER